MAVKIIHAADFHMDSPFASLPEDKARQRRQESRDLLDRVAALAESENAQLVLLSGDLFDSDDSYWETQETLVRVFSRMKAQIFIAPGNHDFYSSRCPYAFMELSENVHIFTSTAVRCVELPELGCRVWGAGFSSPVCPPLLRGFSAGQSDLVDIMVMHGDMGGERYNPISEEEIASSGLNYLALGHIHAYSGILKAGNTYYAYPGCLEGRGFDETGIKGVIAGTVSKTECDLRFVPIQGRRYEHVEVDVSGAADIESAVSSVIGEGRPEDVVKLVLKGEAPCAVDCQTLAAKFSDKFYYLTVKDNTVPERGIWDGADEDSLTGLFLSRMRDAYESAKTDEERSSYLLAARYGIAALEGREGWRP